MSITITAAQRDAIYDEVLIHLSGIEGLWLAIEREDYATADRLGREFADLTLVLDDLAGALNRARVKRSSLRRRPTYCVASSGSCEQEPRGMLHTER